MTVACHSCIRGLFGDGCPATRYFQSEYLPIFTGFGTLPGVDIEYETWHVQEEMRGFNELLRSGGFSEEHGQYLFDQDRAWAYDWPQEKGRPYPYPENVLTLKPDRMLTYEEAAVVVSEMLAEAIPGPQFFRKWRDQQRTRQFNQIGGKSSWPAN